MIVWTLHFASLLALRMRRIVQPSLICLALGLGTVAVSFDATAQTPLQTIEVASDAAFTRLRVQGAQAATFSVYTLRNPFRVFLDVAESDGSALPRRLDVDNGTLRTVQVSNEADALSQTTRIVVELEEETYFDVRNEGNDILIEFQNRTGTRAVAVASPSVATPAALGTGQDPVLTARLRELEAQLAAADTARRDALQRATAVPDLDARAAQMEAELAARDARIRALEQDLAAGAATQDSAARAQTLLEARERELALAQARLEQAEARDGGEADAADARILALEAQVAQMEAARLEQERVTAARDAALREQAAAAEAERARYAALPRAEPAVAAPDTSRTDQARIAERALVEERAALDRERLALAREDASRAGRSGGRETAAIARMFVAFRAQHTAASPTPPPVVVRIPAASNGDAGQATPTLPVVSVTPSTPAAAESRSGRAAPTSQTSAPSDENRENTGRRSTERCRVVTRDPLSGQRTTRTIPCPR